MFMYITSIIMIIIYTLIIWFSKNNLPLITHAPHISTQHMTFVSEIEMSGSVLGINYVHFVMRWSFIHVNYRLQLCESSYHRQIIRGNQLKFSRHSTLSKEWIIMHCLLFLRNLSCYWVLTRYQLHCCLRCHVVLAFLATKTRFADVMAWCLLRLVQWMILV